MNSKPRKVRKFRLNLNKIKNLNHCQTIIKNFNLEIQSDCLDDIKNTFEDLDLRMKTDHPDWEKLGYFFDGVECVPRGYLYLFQKIGAEGIAEMDYDEMEEEGKKLLDIVNTNPEELTKCEDANLIWRADG